MKTENNSSVEAILQDFRTYMEYRDMSENTIHAYLYGAEQFLTMYGAISHDNLMLYKCYLVEHYKPQTVNQRIRAVNCLLESLHLSELPFFIIEGKIGRAHV